MSLKWAKIDHLEKLIKTFHMIMTWKDCLVECVIELLHLCLQN
jgi:hypothetical protein